MKVNPHYKTKSLDKIFDIIEAFSPDNSEMGISELCRKVKMHKSTVHRLITCLESRGYVVQNKNSLKYKLSSRFIGLGFMVLESMDLRTEVHPTMMKLVEKTNMTSHLSIRNQNEVMYLHKVENPSNIISYTRIGKWVPMYCTAMGKVFLSGMSDDEINSYLENVELVKYTNYTIDNREALLKEIEKVKSCGFACDNQELEIGLHCVAVPVYSTDGEIIAALSLSGKSSPLDNLEFLLNELKTASSKIAHSMRYYYFSQS